jgi:hypothetical protein
MHDQHVGLRLTEQDAARVRNLARQPRTSFSEELRRAVENLLAERA